MLFSNPHQDFKNIKSYNHNKIWQPFMEKYHCERVCELGVFKGANFLEMIRHKPKVAVAVDNWKNAGVHTKNDTSYSPEELKKQFQEFQNLVRDYSFVKIVRDSTQNAAKLFPNNHFDFVYVDADSSSHETYRDLIAWYPKVKRSKFLAGHNYLKGFGVVEAVNRFTKEKKLQLALLPRSNWLVVKV